MERLRDTFNGVPGETLTAYNSNWVAVAGTTGVMVINANGASANTNSSAGTSAYVRTDIALADPNYSVSVDLTMVSQVVNGPAAGVTGWGSVEASTQYEARFLSVGTGGGSWQIRRIISGTASTLATVTASPYATGQIFNLRLARKDNTLSLYLDKAAEPLLTAADSMIAGPGLPGLRQFNAISSRFRVTNFVVEDSATGLKYTLEAGAGTFAVSGGAAALRVSRKLAAAAGGFVLAGSSADVRAARRLIAEPASFAATGSSVVLRAARKLTAGTGTFNVTGGAAALVASRRLSAAPGAFAVVGQAATLVHTAAPAPGGPTYVLTAAPGNFALTGAAVAVIAARRLVAGAGVFGIAGAPVRLLVGRRMNGASGAFEVTGAAALLQVARWLPAAAGTFTLAGSDVVFTHSGQIEYARAPAGAGYTPRRSEYQARPVQGSHQSRPTQVSTGGRPPATQENYR